MNPETLKYMIALQKQFKQAMGEWQTGDWGYDQISGVLCLCDCNFPLSFIFPVSNCKMLDRSRVIRLPLPIDPRSPGRGLLGMIKDCGVLHPVSASNEWCYFGKNFDVYGETPDLALLKALAHQHGVEVE